MTGLSLYLQDARQRTLDRAPSAASFLNRVYSGTTYALWHAAAALTAQVSQGRVLDAGSGRGAWKGVIEAAGGTRESVDIAVRPGERLSYVADLTDMPQVPSNRYDAAVCHQVLEHVRYPGRAASEIFRTLKPGGRLVMSVPHLSRLHELPHDYHRFTPNGLRLLLEDAGFEIVEVRAYGGLLTFAHHQFSAVVLGVAAAVRPLFLLCATLNAPLSMLTAAIDGLIDRRGLLANGVVVLARKPESVDHG
jgi:SAM-dependent methyltransferase